MRLRTKFLIVLGLLVATLAANVALSVWSIRFLERELSLPLQSVQSVMQRMYDVKRIGEDEIDLLSKGFGSDPALIEQAGSEISSSEARINRVLADLESLPTAMLRSGISTTKNLRARSVLIEEANALWMGSFAQEDVENLIVLIDTRHELIERVEGRMLEDAELAVDYTSTLQGRIYTILTVSILGAIAIGLILVMFIRRWVLLPIEQLRKGASRLSHGDFDHKIRVGSNDELGQLSDEFNSMGELILEMQERKIEQERLAAMGEMAQRTVHNLRTPLAGIRALSETTLDELPEGSDLHELQSRIISTVDRFEGWLKEMLRASTPLELHLGELCPRDLVESVVESHKDAAGSVGVEIEFTIDSAPERALGDAHHLEHAITSVLSNSIGFAPTGSAIRVHLGSTGGYWTVRISNEGEMIPEDLHLAIFRPYFTTRKDGTGIGLAMCKRVIDQHHGWISVKSPVNRAGRSGCAFSIALPLEARSGGDE